VALLLVVLSGHTKRLVSESRFPREAGKSAPRADRLAANREQVVRD
jgi:hypothetical protein